MLRNRGWSVRLVFQPKAFRASSVNLELSFLLVLAFTVDLMTPLLIWKGILPDQVRWVSHIAIVIMMVVAYARIMVFDHMPGAVWLIAGISVVGSVVAIFQGQSVSTTAWGWWILFRYPMVGLFAYLQPYWPQRVPQLPG